MKITTQRITSWGLTIAIVSAAAGLSTAGDDKKAAQPKTKQPTVVTADDDAAKLKNAKQPAAEAPTNDKKPAAIESKPATPPNDVKQADEAKTKPAAKPAAPPPKSSAAAAALVEQVRKAKSSFTAADAQRLAALRNTALAAAEALEARFDAMSQPNGADWKKYVRNDELSAELRKSSDVDVALLDDVHQRLTAGYDGLEKQPYRTLAAALADYAPAVEAAQNKNLKQDYEQRLDALADALSAVGDAGPDVVQAATIGETTVWLAAHGQAPQLVAELTRRYSHPNLLVDVGEDFLVDTLGGDVDEEEPVVDVIMGTRIRGTGRTIGKVAFDCVAATDRAVITAQFAGTNHSKTVGHNRSALIYSTGTTHLQGATTLFVDEDGLAVSCSRAAADVNNRINCIGSTKGGLVGKIVVKVASKKAPQQQAEAECIAARHAECRLSHKLDHQAAELVEQANSDYRRRLRLPLTRFDALPRAVDVTTSDDALSIRVLQDGGRRLAAPAKAPPVSKSGAALRLHHSLIDNTTQRMLAGRRFDRERLIDLMQNQFGLQVPETDDDTPFAITFADREPVTLELNDGTVAVTVRGKQFMSDDKLYEGMNITARYKAETSGEGIRLTRDGDLLIYPPEFRSGIDKLTVSQTALRRLLQRRFDKMLPGEFVGEGVELEDGRGRLVVSQLQIDDGWAVFGWKHLPTSGAE